jgi:glycerophosphoryl diester phosphodiesterase
VRLILCLLLLSSHAVAAPLLIAHRGASAERPEHTLAAYRLAIEQGADFIEPDLVVTKDGVLVARHDVLLGAALLDGDAIARDADGRPTISEATTDVAAHPEFADRLTVRSLDGEAVAGWFADDFTFAELRTLRARERMPKVRPGNLRWSEERIPSFEEVLSLARTADVGVYPELKHPTYLTERGHDVVALFLTAALPSPDALYVQCFEVEALLRLRKLRPELRLIQLLGALDDDHGSFSWPWDVRHHAAAGHDLAALYPGMNFNASTSYADMATAQGLAAIATYAAGVGPWIKSMDLLDGGAPWLKHLGGLDLHPYTVRPEDRFRVRSADGATVSYEEELRLLEGLGADGIFVEDVDRARAAFK